MYRQIVFLLTACASHTALAQIELDRCYPPAVAVGSETTVKADGKFPIWPATIVCDRDEIKFTPSKNSGEFNVVVPADAVPGVAWIRMYDNVSASKLVPMLIEPLAPSSEIEPNHGIDEAGLVDLPAVLVGRLGKSGDVDTYRVSVQSGQTLVVSVIAHGVLGSPMDAVLQFVDQQGNVILQSDDDRGLDPMIVYEAREDRELLLRLFAFPETPNSTIGYAGSPSFVYSIRATTDAFVDHVLPLVVPSDGSTAADVHGWNIAAKVDVKQVAATECSPPMAYVPGSLGWQWQVVGPVGAASFLEANGDAAAKAAKLPCIFSGHISERAEVDRVRFDVKKGVKYLARAHSRSFGFTLDSVLRVVDTNDGSELAGNDDRERNQYDAAVEFTAKDDREVELQISDLVDAFGKRHAYSVVIEEAKPAVSLTLAADHFIVQAGASIEIPVTVNRLQGFNHKLRVTAERLPDGVRAEPVVSEAKGDSSKLVQLKLTADKGTAHQGALNIVAHTLDAEDKQTGESFTAVHQLRDIVAIKDGWLTVAAAKESK